MESLKIYFLLGIVLGAICSGIQSVQTLASVTPQSIKIIQEGSDTFPSIEYVDTQDPEYDITE